MKPRPNLKVAGGDAGLKISHLRKSYRKQTVIRDFSMELARGEVVALLGPNGSGKTTTFYSVAGLVTPEGGTVLVDGKDVTTLPMYRRAQLGIGYLPQEMSIFRGLSVQDNIAAILDITVSDRHKRRERLEELLSEFSIEHLRRAPALALSGGERRRVEIARCLAADPKYLLLDEPFAGMNHDETMNMVNLVRSVRDERGVTVMLVEHDMPAVMNISDRIVVLNFGEKIAEGTPSEIQNNEKVIEAYLGSVDDEIGM